MAPPSYAKFLVAAAAAGSWLAAYLGPMHPQVAYDLMAGVGTLDAFAAYLGWGTGGSSSPTAAAPTPSGSD